MAIRAVLLNETGSATTKLLFTAQEALTSEEHLHLEVSADLGVLYLTSSTSLTPEAPTGGEGIVEDGDAVDLYRYDLESNGPLRFVLQEVEPGSAGYGPVPDGRYYYFHTKRVVGLPGGERGVNGVYRTSDVQLYRYDSAEDVVECVSCASSFDPEPRWSTAAGVASGGGGDAEETAVAMPDMTDMSADGSRAFFSTRSALVPQDVAGEVSFPEGIAEEAGWLFRSLQPA